MALAYAPFGLRPIRSLSGGKHRIGKYVVSSASARIFRGDPVALVNSTGTITRWTASSVERVVGAAAEEFNQSGTAAVEISVYDAHDTVFEVQSSISSAITQVKFGNPYRLKMGAGDSTLGYSKATVDLSATAASASYVVFAIRLSPKEDNTLSSYSVIECMLTGDATKIARA